MSKAQFPLDKIKVATPCTADWRFMYGNERVRFCGQCSQYVYNLSALTREQAETLILRHEGRLCVRFYRRRDGTIITNNCPVGLRALKEKYHSTKATVLKAILSLLAYLGALWWVERIPVAKPVDMGAVVMPDPYPGGPTITKSEQFIRDKAIYRTTPVAHTDASKPVKGDAVVKIVILPNGSVEQAIFIKGPELILDIVEGAALRWKSQPMTEGGRPVRVESTLTFHFGSRLPERANNLPVGEQKACDECL